MSRIIGSALGWFRKLFSIDGRVGRAAYIRLWLASFAFMFGGAVIADAAEAAVETSALLPLVGGVFFLLMFVCYVVITAFAIVKRFHDLDRRGTHFWRILIPIYGNILLLLLFFKRGTEGPNRFGPDPHPDTAITLSLSS